MNKMAKKHTKEECSDPSCSHKHSSQDSDKKEKLQKRYMEFHILNHQIKEMQKQFQTIDAQIAELESTSQNIGELAEAEEGNKMFVSLSPGVFAKAELKDTKNVLINVGAGTAVEKKAEDVKQMVDNQVSELKTYREQMMKQIEMMVMKAKEFEKELKGLAG